MPRKRARPRAAPGDEEKHEDDAASRKSVSGSGSRSAFTEMRRRARELPSSDPCGRPDDPQRPQDKGAEARNAASRPRRR